MISAFSAPSAVKLPCNTVSRWVADKVSKGADAALVTNNTKEFSRIKGLRLVDLRTS